MIKKIFVIVFVFLFLAQTFTVLPSAFGDGLTQENLPPATFGNRQAALFIKISPPILTKDTVGDTYLQLRLYDANTGQTVPHVSYFISAWHDDKLRLRNLFHAHSGELTLKIVPKNIDVNDVVIYGDEVPQLPGAWTGFNDKVDVHAPLLIDSGLYHFEIKIFGIDYDQNIFAEQDVKTFNSWLSVGDISDHTISYGGKSYPVSVVSYYDQITNFKFDEAKKSISFSMPFNWDTTRLKDQTIFVHQEVRIPKTFKEFTDTTAYDGKVNGIPTIGRMLILDPYSVEDTAILHFLINKDDILNMAKTISPATKTMDFVVSPASAITKNSFTVKLDSGATAQVSYDSSLGAGNTVPLEITFFDESGQLLKFVRHGFRVEDSAGKILVENIGDDPQKPGIMSPEGIDIQEVKFPAEGNYKITLVVFSHDLDELTTYQGIGSATFKIGKGGTTQPTQPAYEIPSWIKNNAGWWAEGTITDNDFVQGIQYLIQKGIIKVPPTQSEGTTTQSIPSWIKRNAGWWADGTIGDSDFVQGIQYLIKQGIIKI
ncbi:MAG TPA: peptidase [Candidatus Nitrosotenuis sp.]|nr:peptidase [Candidatus Nitrosotenuis sp.]